MKNGIKHFEQLTGRDLGYSPTDSVAMLAAWWVIFKLLTHCHYTFSPRTTPPPKKKQHSIASSVTTR